MSFKEMLDGKLIEETGGHFDESDMAMYRAGAKAALELAADECERVWHDTLDDCHDRTQAALNVMTALRSRAQEVAK